MQVEFSIMTKKGFLIESLRQDSLMLFNLKVAQLVSVSMIIIGITLIIYTSLRSKNDK